MKKLGSIIATLLLVGVMLQVGVAQNSADDKTVAAITKLEHDWAKAMEANDDAAVGKILADGWVGQNPDGSTEGKSQFLSEVKKGNYQGATLESVDVKTFGNTAVATGKGSDKTLGKICYMDVFMRQGGGWRAIASSVTPVQAPH